MVRGPSLSQETINLIDEDDSGLELVGEAKHGGHWHIQLDKISIFTTDIHSTTEQGKKQDWFVGTGQYLASARLRTTCS
jgi:hypothetical protein